MTTVSFKRIDPVLQTAQTHLPHRLLRHIDMSRSLAKTLMLPTKQYQMFAMAQTLRTAVSANILKGKGRTLHTGRQRTLVYAHLELPLHVPHRLEEAT